MNHYYAYRDDNVTKALVCTLVAVDGDVDEDASDDYLNDEVAEVTAELHNPWDYGDDKIDRSYACMRSVQVQMVVEVETVDANMVMMHPKNFDYHHCPLLCEVSVLAVDYHLNLQLQRLYYFVMHLLVMMQHVFFDVLSLMVDYYFRNQLAMQTMYLMLVVEV